MYPKFRPYPSMRLHNSAAAVVFHGLSTADANAKLVSDLKAVLDAESNSMKQVQRADAEFVWQIWRPRFQARLWPWAYWLLLESPSKRCRM